jgi:transcriptional regulator GlxA family with amidase domain
VGKAHVAQQPLGVVAQRDGQLAEVARELGPLAQNVAGDGVRLADDLAGVGARLGADALRLLGGVGAELLEVLTAGGDGLLGLGLRLAECPGGLLAHLGERTGGLALRLGDDLLGLGPRGAERLLGLLARGDDRLLSFAAGALALVLGLALGGGAQLLDLGLGVGAHALGVGVDRADGGDGIVACGLGLGAGVAQQLLGLLLGGVDAIGGGAVGLGDTFAGARLGLLAQLGGGALGSVDDAGDARGRGLERFVLGSLVRLHRSIVDLAGGHGRPRPVPILGRKRWIFVLADVIVLREDHAMAADQTPREIVIVLFDGVQSLDVTGPLEVFTGARRLLGAEEARGRGDYEIRTFSADGAPLRTSSGLTLVPNGKLSDAPSQIDTLIVPGGPGTRAAGADAHLLAWVEAAATRSRRTASVCTGAFVLAAAGLLDGRRATTHWSAARALARKYPSVEVDADPIYVRDDNVWTSAGVTAGMDLALALVEDDLDRDAALKIARHLVLFLRRPGNQSQFSATLAAQQPGREPLREVQRLVVEDVGGDHSVEAMASRAHMSTRHFARAFRAETGVTPARYVERVRLEAARRRLEDGSEPIAAIAGACGFGTAETMRRVFLRAFEVGPAEYRRRFQARDVAHSSARRRVRRPHASERASNQKETGR